jgi:hypothetical protein
MTARESLQVITVRLSPDVLDRLPPPSLTGERADYIRKAVEEKLARDAKPRRVKP